MKPIAVLYDPVFRKHDPGPGHPENPRRLQAILDAFEDLREDDRFIWLEPREASPADIARVHAPEYIDWVRKTCAEGGGYYAALEGDMVPETYSAALKAAGAVIQACGKVWEGEWEGAFCLVRPPGHHALYGSAKGFCVFNNAAVGARWLLEERKVSSILIVDFDVHHGNGTQDAFWEESRVSYFSTHQWPHFPGTGAENERGAGEGAGATLNVPLKSGWGDDKMLEAFQDKLIPWAAERKPEILLISAGFDAHEDDPLSSLKVTTECYREMARILKKIADEHCRGRWVITLEGGYDLDALGASARAFLEGMITG